MNTLRLVVALISMVLAVNVLVAQEAAAPKIAPKAPRMPRMLELCKRGTIHVTKDATGKVNVKLEVVSYQLVLNEDSKALETMDGKKVKVTGTFKLEDGKRLIYVDKFEVIKTKEKDAEKKAATKAPAVP